MHRKTLRSLVFATVATIAFAGSVVCSGSPIAYKISVDGSDLSGFDVEMRIQGQAGTIRVAMAAHPEYDDRYFRYVEKFSAESGGRTLSVTKPEGAVWQIDGAAGDITVRYRVTPPPKEREWRQSWKPFLTPTGGMIGDLHMLMYVICEEKRRARLTLDMPADWKAVTGLESTTDPRVFAGTVESLLDSPIMVGNFREWKFTVAGVPHAVAIWSPKDVTPVDASPIVEGIQKLAEQAVRAFGKPPYPRYAFLLENGGQAALEHATSVNVGISSELSDVFEEVAHEYVHVWNLMDVRPRERVGLKHKFAEPTTVLWWNEGATIMFADLLIRRAGLVGDRRPRVQRLESLITRYLSAPGYSTLSAEAVSRGDSHPGLLGDNWASTHLQGEVLTSMLDLMIRDSTNGRRKLDDVMRTLAARFDSDHGIVNQDIERALAGVCECNVSAFFNQYIYGAGMTDFDHYLSFIGLHAEVRWTTALDNDGKPSADLRVGPVSPEGELRLRVTKPKSAWLTAGVLTGDKLVSANRVAIADWTTFRTWLRTLKIGDMAQLVVIRDGVTKNIDVPIKPFDAPTVHLGELENATSKQITLRNAWVTAN